VSLRPLLLALLLGLLLGAGLGWVLYGISNPKPVEVRR
jgi:hypothetical protein